MDELRRTFELSPDDPDDELRKLLLTDGEPDADAFWEGVATNLAAKRLRLLFVADAIPDELAHVVQFLNGQIPMLGRRGNSRRRGVWTFWRWVNSCRPQGVVGRPC